MEAPVLTIDQKIQILTLATKCDIGVGQVSPTTDDCLKNYNAFVEVVTKTT